MLSPTKAAADDLQTIRRLRNALKPDSFHDVLIGVTSAHLAAYGPTTADQLAELALPWLDRWAIDGHPVTAKDLRGELHRAARTLQALDLAEPDHTFRTDSWHPGPSATTLLPRATALAHYFRQHPNLEP